MVASNGLAISEHICNTSKTHSFSFFISGKCGMEKVVTACCGSKNVTSNTKPCCQHKQIFSKLSYDGFIAKEFHVKPYKIVNIHFLVNDYTTFISALPISIYSGLSPPDNPHIQYLLRPTLSGLQVYRC
jgi:hypothetical protein